MNKKTIITFGEGKEIEVQDYIKEKKELIDKLQTKGVDLLSANCTNCEHFESFREEYEDLMEPEDYGRCNCEQSMLHGNEGASISVLCEYHTRHIALFVTFKK